MTLLWGFEYEMVEEKKKLNGNYKKSSSGRFDIIILE